MKFVLTFDELFKLNSKAFFTLFHYTVETDFEIFKLPKKADVLVVRPRGKRTRVPPEFKILTHWKTHNIISYKSLKDRVRVKDIFDAIVYFFGYVNLAEGATPENTSVTLVVSHRPAGFLKKYRRFIEEVKPGKYKIDLNLCQIYIIDLNAIPADGYDAEFLMNYARAERLEEVKRFLEKRHGRGRHSKTKRHTPRARPGKLRHGRRHLPVLEGMALDIIRELLYVRLKNFESTELLENLMATKTEADITYLVKPYYDKGLKEGERKGKREGEREGIRKGERKGKREGKLEAARKLLEAGQSIDFVKRITELTQTELREAGLI